MQTDASEPRLDVGLRSVSDRYALSVLKPLFESARISNLPTVWTNVLVGLAAVPQTADSTPDCEMLHLLVLLISLSLLYTAGMWLNDAADAEWDRRHGKARPIPTGRISRRVVLISGSLAFVLGAAIPVVQSGFDATVSTAVLLLIAAIVLYDLLHKRSVWLVLVMGMCRACVYLLAASLVFSSVDHALDRAGTSAVLSSVMGPCLAILFYVAMLTLAARREDIAGARIGGVWAWLMPLPFVIATFWFDAEHTIWAAAAGGVFVLWTLRCARVAQRERIPEAVSGWIAGICLADGMLLMLLGRPDLAGIAIGLWLVTLLLQRFIPGT